jgi:hypothetical protein
MPFIEHAGDRARTVVLRVELFGGRPTASQLRRAVSNGRLKPADARSGLFQPAVADRGGLNPAGIPLIKPEKLLKQTEPALPIQKARRRGKCETFGWISAVGSDQFKLTDERSPAPPEHGGNDLAAARDCQFPEITASPRFEQLEIWAADRRQPSCIVMRRSLANHSRDYCSWRYSRTVSRNFTIEIGFDT